MEITGRWNNLSDEERYRAWLKMKDGETKKNEIIFKDITILRISLTPSEDESISEEYLSREELMKPIQRPK